VWYSATTRTHDLGAWELEPVVQTKVVLATENHLWGRCTTSNEEQNMGREACLRSSPRKIGGGIGDDVGGRR
jgi:hypothetical protein